MISNTITFTVIGKEEIPKDIVILVIALITGLTILSIARGGRG